MTGTGIDDSEFQSLRRIFAAEADEKLSEIEEGLIGLEGRPDDTDLLRSMFRAAHTIKGGASLVDLEAPARLAHLVEDIFEALREGAVQANRPLVTLLLRAVDGLRTMVSAVSEGETPKFDPCASLAEELAAWRSEGEGGAGARAAEPIREEDHGDADPAGDSGMPGHAPADERTTRVEVPKLDRLLEAVGELGLHHRALRSRLIDNGGISDPAVAEALDEGDRFLEDLRDGVSRMRLVPMKSLFQRFHRTARDAAASSGTQVRLVADDGGVEVDMAIVDELVGPLTHLVRNAVDHGIEPPERRRERGKDPVGQLTLRARRDGEMVQVDVEDDGAGISRERLEAQARQWGVSDPERLSEEELRELLFRPGFSTAEGVTSLSGRGVGMDVVRSTVERMRGSVSIQSYEGEGTTFGIRVPLTLAVIAGLEVHLGDTTYVLPVESVVECVDVPEGADGWAGERVARVSGVPLPVVSLHEVFGGPSRRKGRGAAIVVRHGDLAAALIVDGLTREVETIIRPLRGPLAGLQGIGGSTILEDGGVGLVVDVPGLLRGLASKTEATTTRIHGGGA